MLERPETHFNAMVVDETVVGFSVVTHVVAADVFVLEYLASRADERNKGIGRELFQRCARGCRGRPLIVEVDTPQETADDYRIRSRRKRFYERLGCRTIEGLRYILPLPGRGNADDMELMVLIQPPTKIRRQELRRWLTGLYVEIYSQSADDRRLDMMLETLGTEIRLI